MKKMTLLAMIVLLVSACSSSLKVEVKSGITVEYDGSERYFCKGNQEF